jgi:hypothetical protein
VRLLHYLLFADLRVAAAVGTNMRFKLKNIEK